MRACDVCSRVQGQVAITRYELKVDGKPKITTDLCDDDAAPLLRVIDELPKSVRSGRKRRSFEDDIVDPSQE